MSKSNSNIHEERDSFGSRPSNKSKKEEWVEETFGKKTLSSGPKKPTNNSKSKVKKK